MDDNKCIFPEFYNLRATVQRKVFPWLVWPRINSVNFVFFRVPLEWKLLKVSSMMNHQAWGTGIIIFNQHLLLMGKLKKDQTHNYMYMYLTSNIHVFVYIYMYSTWKIKQVNFPVDICWDNFDDNLLHCNLARTSRSGWMCLSIGLKFWTSQTILSILCCLILQRIFFKKSF